MKKSLPLTLVLAALSVFASLGVAQQQQSPTANGQIKPAPTTRPVPQRATTIKGSKSNQNERLAISPQVIPGKVTEINAKYKTFAVAVTFSSEKMKGDFSRNTVRVGDTIDVTYTQTPGGPMEATTVSSSKSNSSERLADSPKLLRGKVTEINSQFKTFTVVVGFSAAKLSNLPTIGQVVDITYTEPVGGGPLEASNLNLSKSNIN